MIIFIVWLLMMMVLLSPLLKPLLLSIRARKWEDQPETKTENQPDLAQTLINAQQAVYDSWAVVNPLRLKIWNELNGDTPAETPKHDAHTDETVMKRPRKKKPEPATEKEITEQCIATLVDQVDELTDDLKREQSKSATLRTLLDSERERIRDLEAGIRRQNKENKHLHERLGDTAIMSYGEHDPVRATAR